MAVTVTLSFSVKPERAEEFKSLLRDLLLNTRAHEGCIKVDGYQDQDNPGYIYLVEGWQSKVHQQKYQAWRDESGIAETVGSFLPGEPRFSHFDKLEI